MGGTEGCYPLVFPILGVGFRLTDHEWEVWIVYRLHGYHPVPQSY